MATLPEPKLDALLDRHALLQAELSRQLPAEAFVKLSRELAELEPVADKAGAYREALREIADLEAMHRRSGDRCEMRDLAYAETRGA